MKRLLPLTFVMLFAAATAAAQSHYRAEVYYREGARLTLEGRMAEAAAAFERAVALDPDNGNAFYGLGNVYAEMGRWADAVGAYQKAVRLNKADVEAYNNLGLALAARGDYARAEEAFERAVKIYPKWAEPHFHLSRVRRRLGDEEGARQAYDRALRLRPDYATAPPARFQSASAPKTEAASAPKAEAPARDGGGALKAMSAIGLAPDADAKAGGPNTSKPDATDTNATNANTPRTTPTVANPRNSTPPAAAERPNATTTKNASNNAAALELSDARTLYERGLSEARAGRHDEAIASLRRAVLLDRSNAAAYVALGDAYAAKGSWPESVDAYEQAARLDPNDADTYEKLGRSFARLRESRGAKVASDNSSPGADTRANDSTPARANEPAAPRPGESVAEEDADPTAVYRVGPGDVLDVRVLRRGSTTAYEVGPKGLQVTPTGLLAYPTLAEPMKVAGLTTEQIAARLGERLKLRAGGADPELVVGVKDYASHAIIVSGMVKEAGTKILQREGVPLYVIIAYAQPQPGAGQATVVSRVTGRTTAVDLADAGATKMLVRPGDVITVTATPERFVYVAGAVRQPGQKRYHAGLTLTQAVLAAGGAVSTQGAQAVSVTRQGDDGRLATTRHNLADIRSGKTPDPTLRPGDRVEVLK